MITATYQDKITGWETRVTVEGDSMPPTTYWTYIQNAEGEVAYVPTEKLSDFRREQGDNREYLPAWTPTGDEASLRSGH